MPQEVGQKESPCLSVDRIMVPGTHARDEAKSGDEEPKMKRRRAKVGFFILPHRHVDQSIITANLLGMVS